MSNMKVFAMQDQMAGWPAGKRWLTTKIHMYVDQKSNSEHDPAPFGNNLKDMSKITWTIC